MTAHPAITPAITPAVEPGVWVGASYTLGRPAPVDGPYPHICTRTVTGRMTGRLVVLGATACAACAQERHHRRRARTTASTVPAVDAMALAAGDTQED